MKKTALLAIVLAFLASPVATFANETTTTTVKVEEKVSTKIPTFDDVLIKFIDTSAKVGEKIGNAASQMEDFATKEIPLVIQEYLTWHWVESFFWSIGIGGMFLALSGTLFKKVIWNNRDKEWYNSRGDLNDIGIGVGFAIAGTIILTIIGSLITSNNMDWVKISVAPRVYLIDKAATFMKK